MGKYFAVALLVLVSFPQWTNAENENYAVAKVCVCPDCSGSGKLECEYCNGRDLTKLTCEYCKGRDLTALACEYCRGTGNKNNARCVMCRGSGRKSRCVMCVGTGKQSRCVMCRGT